MNGIPFRFSSLDLDDAEISKVCHEINTVYFVKYQNKKLIMHRTMDSQKFWCIYFVENRGYGDYNIIEKYYD